jgi:RNA polymerase sigma-70 factor (ECF subfamily)
MALVQPDRRLLSRAQHGEEQAFAELVRMYETPVFDYIRRLLPDRSLAEDLTQEVFLSVYQALPRFAGRCQFTSWLFQVTRHRVLDEIRSTRRRPRTEALEASPEFASQDAPPEQRQAMAALWHAVGELKLELKMPLLLRDVVGLSYAEIAEALEIELTTVKWRIYHAREIVQEALERQGHAFGADTAERVAAPTPRRVAGRAAAAIP